MNARAAAAGATAALVWAAAEPLDQRIFGCDYSDTALLGKAVSRRYWRPVGLAMHALNGAAFGLTYDVVRRWTDARPVPLGVGMAVTENTVLWPLCVFVDRYHPARGEPGLPPLARNGRAFAQATWRHALFGVVLGRLAAPRRGKLATRGAA
jgi:hypothetical protein